MFCPMCGAPNEEDSIFCGNCGAVLNPDEAPAAAVIEPEIEAVAVEPGRDESLEVPPVRDVSTGPPPPPTHAPTPAVPTSGMAIASLILGIGGLTVLPLIGSVVAIILGYMARKDIRQRPRQVSGEGLALAGIVLGWISVGLAVIGLLVFGGIVGCGLCGAFSSGNF